MFECKLKSKLFHNLIEVISSIIPDGSLVVGPNGISLSAIEETRVGMIKVLLSKELCETYTCDKETELKIDFQYMNNIVSRIKTGTIQLKYLESENKLQLKNKHKRTRTYIFSLLENIHCESINSSLPSLDAQIVMDSKMFSTALKDAAIIGKEISFSAMKNGNFSISVYSEFGDLSIEFAEKISEPIYNDIITKYDVEYLRKMTKSNILSQKVSINFGQDTPIILKYIIDEETNSTIEYFLAPQVDEEEEGTEEEIEEETEEENLDDKTINDEDNNIIPEDVLPKKDEELEELEEEDLSEELNEEDEYENE